MPTKINGKPAASAKPTPSFLKTGSEATTLYDQEKAAAEVKAAEQGKLWRFRIGKEQLGEDFKITFLDGGILPDGRLDAPVFKEHTIQRNGKWLNFIATGDTEPGEPDPLEEDGSTPQFRFVLTVIDHTEYEGKNGKTYKNSKRLFVGPRTSYELLMKLANKYNGLAGCTFEVSRNNDRSPAVGDTFLYLGKSKLSEIAAEYGEELAQPANYGEELTYRSTAELRKLGFGSKAVSVGSEKASKDLSKEM